MQPDPDRPAARKNSWRWPVIIISMLFVHVMIMMIAVVITLQHPGESAVIPDYYTKAQAYDSYKQQVNASAQLGWKVDIEPTGQIDALGARQMRLSLVDSRNLPVTKASVSVHCFHWSHGDEAATLTADAAPTGPYTFALPAKYVGFWQFEVMAQAGDRKFVQTLTQFIN